MTASLKAKTYQSIGYNAMAKVVTFTLQAAANIILARRLAPNDYGIIGFAMIFINFLAQFNEFGINSAVVQEKELADSALYTGFSMKVLFGFIALVISFLLAPLAKYIFDNAAVVGVVRLISLSFIINAMAFLPTTLITRDLNFKLLNFAQVGSALINSVVSIVLALNGFNYWSIVIANLCASVVSVVILNLLHPVRPRFCLDREKAAEYLHFGGNIFLSGIITFALINTDNLIVGAMEGAKTLGFYAIAFTWGSVIAGISWSVVSNVLFPTFARIQDDRDRIKKGYLMTLEMVALLGLMANLSLFIASREFLVFLGDGTDKWLPALQAFRILCLYGMIRVVLEPVAGVIISLGLTRLLLKANGFASVVQIALLYPVVRRFGIQGVAALVTISYAVQYLVYFPALKKELGLTFGEVFASLRTAIAAAVIVYLLSNLFVVSDVHRFGAGELWIKLFVSATLFLLVHGLLSGWRIIRDTRSLFRGIQPAPEL
jgi:O-antigen/teichoic acid export membrane protein